MTLGFTQNMNSPKTLSGPCTAGLSQLKTKLTKKTNPNPSSSQQQKVKHTKEILYLTPSPQTHTHTAQRHKHSFLVHTSTIFYILDNGLSFGGPRTY